MPSQPRSSASSSRRSTSTRSSSSEQPSDRRSPERKELQVCDYLCKYTSVIKSDMVQSLNINQRDLDPILKRLEEADLCKAETRTRRGRESNPTFSATEDCHELIRDLTEGRENNTPLSRLKVFND